MNQSLNLSILNAFFPIYGTKLAEADTFIEEFTFYVFTLVKLLSILYSITCAFWLFYVISDILSQLRYKRSLLKRSHTSDPDLIRNNLFQCRERLVRNSLLLIFLAFEMCFSILGNFVGMYSLIPSFSYPQYPQDYNCTRILHVHRDHYDEFESISIFLDLFSHLEHLSFSMMIWMFGASLFHLSIAARNKLNVRALIEFTLGGTLLNLLIIIVMLPVYPLFYSKLVQTLRDQLSLIVVFYISKKKFFPAMNSRVIDAFHLNTLTNYHKQKRLLWQYNFLVKLFLVIFEIYVLKDLLIYNTYLILHSLGIKSCLNHSPYYLIFLVPNHDRVAFLYNISYIFLVFVPIIDTFVYFSICLVNLVFICSLALRFIKRRFTLQPHRFHVLRVPLNPNTTITVIAYK